MFDCEVIASRKTEQEMQRLGVDYLEETRQHHRHLAETLWDVDLVYPTRVFEGRLILDVAPSVTIIKMGGHTCGTSVVHVPEDKLLFASDLVFNGIHPYTKGADISRWIEALGEILEMDVDIVVPGHGPVCGKEGMAVQRDYLIRFWERLGGLKQRGYTVEQIAGNLALLELPELHRPRRLVGSLHAHWNEV